MNAFAKAFASVGIIEEAPKQEVKKSKNIDKIIDQIIDQLEDLRRNGVKDWDPEFQAVFKPAYWDLDAHKLNVLRKYIGKTVTLTGNIIETRNGNWCKDNNMTRISPAYINGIRVQHVHINNKVAQRGSITNNLGTKVITLKAKVYEYVRTDGSIGMSIGESANSSRSYNRR